MKDNDASPPTGNVHKFVRAHAARHPADGEETPEAFQEARAQSREAKMLDVRLLSGEMVSFPYASLRKMTYRPTGVVVLQFDRDEVEAKGKNLLRLRDLIAEHRARYIQEGTDEERDVKPEDAVHIDRIVITEGER